MLQYGVDLLKCARAWPHEPHFYIAREGATFIDWVQEGSNVVIQERLYEGHDIIGSVTLTKVVKIAFFDPYQRDLVPKAVWEMISDGNGSPVRALRLLGDGLPSILSSPMPLSSEGTA